MLLTPVETAINVLAVLAGGESPVAALTYAPTADTLVFVGRK
jgi:hypothetical protein